MDRNEYERLKEAEKEHLRSIRRLKEQLRQAKKRSRITGSLSEMDPSDLLERLDRGVEELTREAIEAEARLSIALEQTGSVQEARQLDDETRSLKARALIEQLSREIDTGGTDDSERSAESENQSTEQLPEKTIGKMTPHKRN